MIVCVFFYQIWTVQVWVVALCKDQIASLSLGVKQANKLKVDNVSLQIDDYKKVSLGCLQHGRRLMQF